MPWRRRECRSEPVPPLPQGQLPYAAHSQSSRQCSSHVQRKHLRDRVPPPGGASGTQSSHRGDRPSALSADLDHSAPWGPLRRTRPGGDPKIAATPHCEDDPRTAAPWLPDRRQSSIQQSGMNGAGFSTHSWEDVPMGGNVMPQSWAGQSAPRWQ
jgi:hypothetical protein